MALPRPDPDRPTGDLISERKRVAQHACLARGLDAAAIAARTDDDPKGVAFPAAWSEQAEPRAEPLERQTLRPLALAAELAQLAPHCRRLFVPGPAPAIGIVAVRRRRNQGQPLAVAHFEFTPQIFPRFSHVLVVSHGLPRSFAGSRGRFQACGH